MAQTFDAAPLTACELESGQPRDNSLSAALEALAETYAAHPHGMTLSAADVINHIAMFNEAAAAAWSLETAIRSLGASAPLANGDAA